MLPNVAQTRFGCCPGVSLGRRRPSQAGADVVLGVTGGERSLSAALPPATRDLDALRILLLRSRRRRERRAAGNEESAAVAAVAAAAAVAAIRVAAAAAAAVAAVAAVVAPPLHSSRSPAPFLRSASYGAGASARRSHSARPAPDALPLRSVVATRSRRAGRRAVSVGGRRTLNSTALLVGGAEASSVGPASVLPPSAGDGGNENAIRYTWRTGFFSSDDPRGASRALGAPPSRARAGQCSRELRNRRGRVDSRAGARRRLVASSSPRPDAKIWARGRALPAR